LVQLSTKHPTPPQVVSADAAALQLVAERAELAEQALDLSSSLNLRRTALRLLALVRPRLAEWVTLVMPDSTSGGLAFFGGDETTFSDTVSRSSAIGTAFERVLRSGRTDRLPVRASADDLSAMVPHPKLSLEAAEHDPAEVLGLPLNARGATLGVLVLVRDDGRGFDDAEVDFAEHIASRAAMALDSARLYEERALIASELAHRIRPLVLPEVDGIQLAARYRPAAEHFDIGGDFYDVHGADDDWLICLGDVAGKGVEAAVLTDRTRQSIRTAAYFDRSPTALLGALNTVLHTTGSHRFVTVVCARLRLAADHVDVELAVAGHPPPIVLRANGTVDTLEVSGLAIGLMAEARYHSVTLRLDHGDSMLMFTDGIDEAHVDSEFYGLDRLIALLPPYAGAAPEVICEAVERDVVEYLDGRPHDDIALLAVTCGK
jgi:serine phosphatase RsbU (regulator of sigma subunit)